MAPKPKAVSPVVSAKVDNFDHRENVSWRSKGHKKSRIGANGWIILLIIIIFAIAIIRAATTTPAYRPVSIKSEVTFVSLHYGEERTPGWQIRVVASALLITLGAFMLLKSLSKTGNTISFHLFRHQVTLIRGSSSIARVVLFAVGVLLIFIGIWVFLSHFPTPYTASII